MNNRRKLVAAIGACALAAIFRSFAQMPAKVRRIGFLGSETAAGLAREIDAFRGGLRDLGYLEGRNIVVEYRWAEGVRERLPQLAAELLREKVDVLVTYGGAGVRAAHRATTTVPIVIASLGIDPVKAGLVKSLARPGGNLTGTLSLGTTLAMKQLEIVKDSLPNARKVAFMISPTGPGEEVIKSMGAAAKLLKLDLQLVQLISPNEYVTTIAAMAERRVDAIIVQAAPFFIAHEGRIAELAAHRRIPALGPVRFADNGGLMGYGTNILNNYRRAAYFIDRIFKGARPGDLPIEQPTEVELVVNLKTAKTLGITIPPTVMARADRVIQ